MCVVHGKKHSERELGKAAIFHQPTISHLESSNSIVVVKARAAVEVEVSDDSFQKAASPNSLSKLISPTRPMGLCCHRQNISNAFFK